MVLFPVCIVDSEERAGKGSDLSEGDKQRVVYLAFGVNIDSAEEKYESTDSKDSGGDKLYVQILFHGAKVVKKCEAGKKPAPWNRVILYFSQSRVKS